MAHAAVFDHHPPPLARAIDYPPHAHPSHLHHGHQQHPPPPPPASSSSAIDSSSSSYAHHISIVPGPAPTPGPSAARKRKLSPGPEVLNEARRLRRSHEACVRCRSKKIKCDSNHPRCGSCVQANTECHQEDRHRHATTPRGHQEQLEARLAVCSDLLARFIPGFSIETLHVHAEKHGVLAHRIDLLSQAGIVTEPAEPSPPPGPGIGTSSSGQRPHLTPLRTQSMSPAHRRNSSSMHIDPTSPLLSAMSHHHTPLAQAHNYVSPPAPQHPESPPTAFTAHSTPLSAGTPGAQAVASSSSQPLVRPLPPPRIEVKGQDPRGFDMTNSRTMITSFDPNCEPSWFDGGLNGNQPEREDATVSIDAMQRPPRVLALWQRVSVVHPLGAPQGAPVLTHIYLPRDQDVVKTVCDIYFEHLNWHRPVFTRKDFDDQLAHLYSGTSHHDPGFILCVYLILALGTLCEINIQLVTGDPAARCNREEIRAVMERQYRSNWPRIDEFWERARAIKPDLRLTISSVQALILFQWYLYIERHGRTLYRLTGTMVRLGVELGLHHNPWKQPSVFTPDECRLRERLWCTILIHDRGTAVLLGRPIAIAPADTTSPEPRRERNRVLEFSDHFFHSHRIMTFQADILCELYRPDNKSPDAFIRQCLRILGNFQAMRKDALLGYHPFFEGPEGDSLEEKTRVVETISMDAGLTLLKFWIAKLLALRVLFLNEQVGWPARDLFLRDALITAHNIIAVHKSLVRHPTAAFFVSPIPLHISAMTIIYGVMMNNQELGFERSLDDVWLALSTLPHLRWRWERKDLGGGHPVILKLAEKVFRVTLAEKNKETTPCVLIPEMLMSEYGAIDDRSHSRLDLHHSSAAKGNGRWSASSTPAGGLRASPNGKMMVHSPRDADGYLGESMENQIHHPVPQQPPTEWRGVKGLFWPLDEQNPMNGPGSTTVNASAVQQSLMPPPSTPLQYGGSGANYSSVAAVGCAPSQQSYINEEHDAGPAPPEMDAMMPIVNMLDQQGVRMLQDQTPYGSYNFSNSSQFLAQQHGAGLPPQHGQHHQPPQQQIQHMVPRGQAPTTGNVFQQQPAPPRMHSGPGHGGHNQPPPQPPHQPQYVSVAQPPHHHRPNWT